MILVTVTGHSIHIKKALHANKFRWKGKEIGWQKIIPEASLDRITDAIRPPVSLSDEPSPSIIVDLQLVDMAGKPIDEDSVRVHLLHRAGEVRISEVFAEFVAQIRMGIE